MQKYGAVLLIGLLTLGAGDLPARRGAVRADGRAVADAAGPFNALGATLFWGAWGYKFDRARLERNLAALSAAGVDYVRVLGSVGGASWEDRQTDPRWDDYDAIIAGMTDLAYDRHGLRVQWTIFGGAPFTEAAGARRQLVDRFAAMARGREHKIFAFEIANEAWQNGFRDADGLAELRALGAHLNDRTSVLVALSAPAAGAACATYAGAAADVMTLHYERGFGGEGPLRPLRLPWSFPAAYDASCRGRLPSVVLNNEPIGPESSVEQDDSPARIAAGFVLTFLAGNAAYVLHTGPGIRGGGKADVEGRLERHANFDELPSFTGIAAALRAAKHSLPAGLANWTRHDPNAAAAPLYGYDDLYLATHGKELVGLAIGVDRPVAIRSRVRATLNVRRITTGAVVLFAEVGRDGTIALKDGDAFLITGRLAD